jgi:hypothetical protein
MADLTVTFLNNYGESRQWAIWDSGRDPNAPPVIFNGYLAPGESTAELALYSGDGVYGRAVYQRSDGAATVEDSITDRTTVRMS